MVEELERRELLSVWTVNSTTDTGTGSVANQTGDLRFCITQANADQTTPRTIDFAIAGSGVQTITLISPLPTITSPVMIDGTTQGNYARTPLIDINGAALSSTDSALTVAADSTTIRALAINDCPGTGITLEVAGGGTIAGCFIGTTADGTTAASNGLGIVIAGSSNDTIGGTGTHDRNLISGNTQDGILLTESANNVGTDNTLIENNFIGTDITGSAAVPNVGDGINVLSTQGVTIGGTTSGTGNLISGTGGYGIELGSVSPLPDTNETLIQGNIFGLNAAGTGVIGNGSGIYQNGADNTTIGGTTAGAGNIISGSRYDGISMGAGNNSLVEGNDIGTDITGAKALGNYIGLTWNGASYTTVGGTTAAARNIISGNTYAGIDSFVNGSGYEVIQGNYIGVDVTGANPLPNHGIGVRLAGPTQNTIGGTVTGAGNVISANTGDGINFTVGPADGTVVEGNFIGTDASGKLNLGNGGAGVVIDSNAVTIGGTTVGAGNIIAHNKGNGIGFVSTGAYTGDSILSNSIYGNGGLGINFGAGPTPNQVWPPGPSNPGPNNYQNYPVLTSLSPNSQKDQTEITGTLNGPANTTFLVQFFASPAADPSGYGQGKTYLGQTTVTTNSSYDASIDVVLPGIILAGYAVSATATDPHGDTSEFSRDLVSQASQPETIELSAVGYTVAENAGTATITVNRVNGAKGTVTVDYTTAPISATPGVDYTPVSGTLTFPNGVTSENIVVPVLDNPNDRQNELLSVILSNVQSNPTPGQAILGSPSTATLTIVPLPAIIGENVLFTRKFNKRHRPVGKPYLAGFELDFSTPMDPASAGNPGNYRVDWISTRRVRRKTVTALHPLSFRAQYNAANHSVDLLLNGRQTFARGGQIAVIAAPPNGVKSDAGVFLDGNDQSVAGDNGTFTILPRARGIRR